MRALTLTQPWAGLVASGIKLVENRPRRMIKPDDFGVPFAIHASGRPVSAEVPWTRLSRITSAVIAVAAVDRAVIEWDDGEIVDANGINGGPRVNLGDQRHWFFGPIGYLLRDVRALETPIPCRGRLGFWTLPPDVESAVRAQLGGDHE